MINTPKFLFDTADLDVIKRTWEKLDGHISPQSVAGITTNPNALSKIGCLTVSALESLVYDLSLFLESIRDDELANVHVQLPYSHASSNEITEWIKKIEPMGAYNDAVVMKIPPYPIIMDYVTTYEPRILLNVTGVSDAATAIRCSMNPLVSFVSIIPGRMEEVNLDATAHLQFVRHVTQDVAPYIIAGSMRTVSGTQRSITTNCIPTIGQRVWDAMTDTDYVEFASWWDTEYPIPMDYLSSIPIIDHRNITLTKEFFEQMDILGDPLYQDFKRII